MLVDIDFVEILQTRVIHLPLTNQGLVSSFRYFSPIRFILFGIIIYHIYCSCLIIILLLLFCFYIQECLKARIDKQELEEDCGASLKKSEVKREDSTPDQSCTYRQMSRIDSVLWSIIIIIWTICELFPYYSYGIETVVQTL